MLNISGIHLIFAYGKGGNKMFRIGIIGVGNMGGHHLNNIVDGNIKNAMVTAVCDIDKERLCQLKEKFGDKFTYFQDGNDLIHSGLVDGVIIATPHYDHPILSEEAFRSGLHVFCEKPVGVFTKNVREMNELAERSGKVFQANFVLRTQNGFKKIKEIIDNGVLGEIKRVTWIITNWYRTQKYYDSGTWRATWAGEGGGLLINQNPHQLDLWQWMFGVPDKVRGFCYYGKNRDIEVEDEANLFFEYKNGMVGNYITTVSEYPGTNRLEIAGDEGKLVFENGLITLFKLSVSEREFNKSTDTTSGTIPMEETEIPYEKNTVNEGQIMMIQNWVNAVLFNEPLIAPGTYGINSLLISNAAYLSSWKDECINIPFDEEEFLTKLNEKIKTSSYVKKEIVKVKGDMNFTEI